MPAPKSAKPAELPLFWFPHPSEGYALGEVLHQDDAGNMHVKLQVDGENKVSEEWPASRHRLRRPWPRGVRGGMQS